MRAIMKQKKRVIDELTVTELARLKSIFDNKGWPIEEGFDDNRFENFCELLGEHEPADRALLLRLTDKFLWVRELDYIKHFSLAFDHFITDYSFGKRKNIIICPLLPEDDFGKIKSSTTLFYLIRARIQAVQDKYQGFSIGYIDNPQSIQCERVKENSVLCLIDDFIGSGSTAVEAADYFLKQEYPQNQIVILSLVAMEDGLNKLKANGYCAYTSLVEKKGITGSGQNEDSDSQLMYAIEERIGVEEDYKFGYAASEALVSMIRTPNNTFPVYWFKNKKKKLNLHAPFPR